MTRDQIGQLTAALRRCSLMFIGASIGAMIGLAAGGVVALALLPHQLTADSLAEGAMALLMLAGSALGAIAGLVIVYRF